MLTSPCRSCTPSTMFGGLALMILSNILILTCVTWPRVLHGATEPCVRRLSPGWKRCAPRKETLLQTKMRARFPV
ncbi:hypothetical protein BJV82DRAFT_635370 [Fennellomyces sp. T-0311]|nr:hypothetical protein BJV82DRAFT_635370 [Fennellomyces sp. T-0311]